MKVLEWHIYPNVLEDKYIFIDFNPASIQKHKQNPHYRYLNGTTQTEKEEEEKNKKQQQQPYCIHNTRSWTTIIKLPFGYL